jgi:hypothetical protein
MGFGLCNCVLKIQKSIWDSNSHNGSSLGSVRIHYLTLLVVPGACEVTLGPSSWPATLQPPCFRREPKARVMTYAIYSCPIMKTNSFGMHTINLLHGTTNIIQLGCYMLQIIILLLHPHK